MTWDDLDAHLDRVPGTVSAYVGRLDAPPTWTRHAGRHPLRGQHDEGGGARRAAPRRRGRHAGPGRPGPGAQRRSTPRSPDAPGSPAPSTTTTTTRSGTGSAAPRPLRWLADRMIVRSSNLATNIVIGQVGLPAVAEAWALAGARHSVTGRGIEDFAAREAGITNLVTAADLAALLGALATGGVRARPARLPGRLRRHAGRAARPGTPRGPRRRPAPGHPDRAQERLGARRPARRRRGLPGRRAAVR